MVIDYIEYQNRVIYTTPNGRKYGIYNIQWNYYFNRDEGSTSDLYFWNIEDVKAYLNQHNQASPWCTQAKERKCY
jgi:hypothetical protein